MTDKIDIHQQITDRIVAQIEAGAGQFEMPWHRSNAPLHIPKNCDTGKRYRGINIISLWMAAEAKGYSSNVWGTYKQWQEQGAQVRKGEKASVVVFFKEFHTDPRDDNDDGRRLVARASWSFNAAQVEGYEATEAPTDTGAIDRIAAADAFVSATGATVRTGGERAFYSPSTDHIQMPTEGLFIGDQQTRSENYYSTLLHELTHWSGAKKRLDRQFGKRFADEAYAFEELVAELGAAFLCSSIGITNAPRADHAKYIANWLQILKGDKRAIFSAASKASAAADYLASLGDQTAQMAA